MGLSRRAAPLERGGAPRNDRLTGLDPVKRPNHD